MDSCLLQIKRKIQILVITTNLVSFIVITIITNNQKENYIEYTSLPKFCSNIYIIISFIIMLIHSINPKFICNILSDNLSFITTDIGKIIITLSLGILFWSSNNKAHVVFEVINFVSSFALFLCEFIFQCKILNNVHFDKGNFNGNIEIEKSFSKNGDNNNIK